LNDHTASLLSLVVPCYNEEEVLPSTNERLLALLQELKNMKLISEESNIYYIDDGSKDGTWNYISNLALEKECIHGIKLSRNFGHQSALLAGLLTVESDIIISIDADLQDDISVIKEMVSHYEQGSDIVYGVRKKRDADSFFKRVTAEMYYKLLRKLGVDVVFNHADYRLMSKRAIEALKSFKEVNIFLRGIIPSIGYKSSVVTYERDKRLAGETKYPVSKMIGLAVNGITSFSAYPLRIVAILGMLIFLISIATSLWVLWVKYVSGDAIPGWASSVLPMYLLGGIQLFSIGLIGEYVSKVYLETKQRPRYFIDKVI